MDKLIDAITRFGFPGAFACSLVLSLIGLAGTYGAVASAQRGRAWRGWVAWWAGTAVYYALQLLFPKWGYDFRWWIPQLALDGATYALLANLVEFDETSPLKGGRHAWYAVLAAIVLIARVADIAIVASGTNSWVHQCLDMAVFLAWAWKARMNIKEALVIAGYGIAQLPLPALLPALRVDPKLIDPNQLLQMTAQYTIAKPALLVAIVSFLRELPAKVPAVATGRPSVGTGEA